MDFYRSLIADPTKRFSLLKNDLVEFNFNTSVFSLQFHPSLYNALAKLELTDAMTASIRQGVIASEGRALSVRVHKIQQHQHFDKFLFLVKPVEENFDFEMTYTFEDLPD